MIANFQSRDVAQKWCSRLVSRGWLFATVKPYKGGHQVHRGYLRASYD